MFNKNNFSILFIFIVSFFGTICLGCNSRNDEKFSPIIIEPTLPNSVWPMNSSKIIDVYHITINYGDQLIENIQPSFKVYRNILSFYLNKVEYNSLKTVFDKFIEWDEIAKENKVMVKEREIPDSVIIGEQLSVDSSWSFYGEHFDRIGWAKHGYIRFYFSSDGHNGILTITPTINFMFEGKSYSPTSISLNIEQIRNVLETYTDEYLQSIHDENLARRNQREEMENLRKQEEMEKQEIENMLFQ
jgi:hypothetical protein